MAVGTGRNLGRYGPAAKLVGIDVSTGMLAHARARRDRLGVSADLREGDAQHLDFPDHSFDTVLATLALCSIPDDGAAVTEMARVLRPGGRLLLVEHVASPRPLIRAAQRLLDPLFVRLQGDHLLRQPDRQVAAAGLVIDETTHSGWGITLRLTAHKRLG